MSKKEPRYQAFSIDGYICRNWCEAELEKLDYKASVEYTNKDVWRIATSYFTIWRRRWDALAEKFKEAK